MLISIVAHCSRASALVKNKMLITTAAKPTTMQTMLCIFHFRIGLASGLISIPKNSPGEPMASMKRAIIKKKGLCQESMIKPSFFGFFIKNT